jgi:hypothetical protein
MASEESAELRQNNELEVLKASPTLRLPHLIFHFRQFTVKI